MKNKKLIKKAVKALDELKTFGIDLTYHCEGSSDYTSCWRVNRDEQFKEFALVNVDGTVWL